MKLDFFKDPLGNFLVSPPPPHPPALKLVRLGHAAEAFCHREEEGSDRKGILAKEEGDTKPSGAALKRSQAGEQRVFILPQPKVTGDQCTIKIQRGR